MSLPMCKYGTIYVYGATAGIRDQRSEIRDQGSGIRDQGSGIRDQKNTLVEVRGLPPIP
jgi:hypothetical protein